MSRVTFRGETLPDTDDEAELYCLIAPPDAPGPRQDWTFTLNHTIITLDPATGKRTHYRNCEAQIDHLHFNEPDWRKFSGLHIRADSAWHDRHEYIDQNGGLIRPQINVSEYCVHYDADGKQIPDVVENWTGENFILRLGTRDGFLFPAELDAWVMPEKEWPRTTRETAEEAARFPETPPDLRIITAARFLGGRVEVPRCGMDPVPLGRQLIRNATGFDDPPRIGFQWAAQSSPDFKTCIRPPGWRSTVHFFTEPED